MNRYRGLTIAEVTVALVIAAAALGGLAQLVSSTAAQRRITEQRRLALQEVANQAERISLLSWDEWTTERLANLIPSDEWTAAASQGQLKATLSDEAGQPPARRIRLEATWANSAGQTVEPVGLTIWKYQPAEGTP